MFRKSAFDFPSPLISKIVSVSLIVAVIVSFSIPPEMVTADQSRHVVINEVLPNPESDWNEDEESSDASDEFVELYNPTSSDVNISCWVLDDTEGYSAPFTIPECTILPAKGFITFFSSDTGIQLDNGGDEVRFFNRCDELIDSYEYTYSVRDVSYTRSPAGSDSWITSDAPTPRTSTILSLQEVTGYVLTGKVVPMTSEDAVISNASVLVRDGLIEAVWNSSEGPPPGTDVTGVVTISTNGIIFPGLIDTHNHVEYNMLPLYNVPTCYGNRYQWTRPACYKTDVSYPKKILTQGSYDGLRAEVITYAEVKALVGGGTALQGSTNAKNTTPVRNIGCSAFGTKCIYSHVLSIDSLDADKYLKRIEEGKLKVLFLHIAEGTDLKSRKEFDTLKEEGLLLEQTVIIHGTALTRSNFKEMAAAGTKLVWSPLSNLLLYGKTTDVKAAWEEGVTVSLAPDWSPSGSKNVLGELKVADQWNKHRLGTFFTDYQLVQMVTVNAAKVCNWTAHVGTIQPGLCADLLVIRDPGGDPYRALIDAIDSDVLLVTVGGNPLYGMVPWMDLLKPGDYEIIGYGNVERGLDVTGEGGNQKLFAEIQAELEHAMLFDTHYMHCRFKVVEEESMNLTAFKAWFQRKFKGVHSIPLTSIFAANDLAFFAAINDSTIANLEFDIYEIYYTKPLDSDADGVLDKDDAFPMDPTRSEALWFPT